MSSGNRQPLRALIVGGGVAGLEAALALRNLAGERVTTTMLTPELHFVYRPMRVREPFGDRAARRYPLQEIACDAGFELRQDALKRLDAQGQMVYTEARERLSYDALLLALGTVSYRRFRHALTVDDRRLDEQLHGLIQDVEQGYIRKLAFIIPNPAPWPLPVYELALMTARRAWDMNIELSITVVTPEDAPLAIFGQPVSRAINELLEGHGIFVVSSTECKVPRRGEVVIHTGGHRLYVDRVIALPELLGPSVPGVPRLTPHGFIPIDPYCKVVGTERVFAAGDATDFTIKHGGIAAQQADVAAECIAALAGEQIEPSRFEPRLHAMLLGANKPLYITADVPGNGDPSSGISEKPAWSPPTKIVAKHLAPYLDSLNRAAER